MLLVGISFLLCWLLNQVFDVELIKAILATGIIFTLVGLVLEHPWTGWRKP